MDHAAAHPGNDGERKGTLYVVATPIGNLGDVSLRALDVLKKVALIAAEDTRVTSRLLHHYGINTPLSALHEHNETRAIPQLLKRLACGESIALVSDAGTPAISDPGAHFVAAARSAGHTVSPVPGANAAVAALSAAGLAAPQFLFYGFLPQRAAERRRELARLAAYPFTLVFFEAPHRIVACLGDMITVFGPSRRLVLARELTKLFETIHACTLAEAVDWLGGDEHRRKGEFVLIVEGAGRHVPEAPAARDVLEILMAELPLKQAVALATRISGAKRNELYELALRLKSEQ
jgi:16S rRNA (cytidine1402-2'-O)-methyltransferase